VLGYVISHALKAANSKSSEMFAGSCGWLQSVLLLQIVSDKFCLLMVDSNTGLDELFLDFQQELYRFGKTVKYNMQPGFYTVLQKRATSVYIGSRRWSIVATVI